MHDKKRSPRITWTIALCNPCTLENLRPFSECDIQIVLSISLVSPSNRSKYILKRQFLYGVKLNKYLPSTIHRNTTAIRADFNYHNRRGVSKEVLPIHQHTINLSLRGNL